MTCLPLQVLPTVLLLGLKTNETTEKEEKFVLVTAKIFSSFFAVIIITIVLNFQTFFPDLNTITMYNPNFFSMLIDIFISQTGWCWVNSLCSRLVVQSRFDINSFYAFYVMICVSYCG